MEKRIGKWAFIIGVILAVLFGFVVWEPVILILAILGLIVGFINIGTKETKEFLIATIALLVVGAAGLQLISVVGTYIQSILSNIVAFVAPAALVVALKTVYSTASESIEK